MVNIWLLLFDFGFDSETKEIEMDRQTTGGKETHQTEKQGMFLSLSEEEEEEEEEEDDE